MSVDLPLSGACATSRAESRGGPWRHTPRGLASVTVGLLSWLIPIAFLAWALRLAILEGYVYEVPGNFPGDFSWTTSLGLQELLRRGMFYGPIFVLEWRYLADPELLSHADFARLDYGLFLASFACTWLALFGTVRPRLAIFVLAAWLAHHASVEAFSNTAHPEILEFALICASLLVAVRGRRRAAGGLLGLAMSTKTLPGLFLPYLALRRQWSMLLAAAVMAGVVFFVVCWIQGITPVAGLVDLVYQNGNLTKLSFTEYEYSPRADFARIVAGSASELSADQAALVVGLHVGLSVMVLALVGWIVLKADPSKRHEGLFFGLVAAAMLIVSPSVHLAYYIFLLPAWTAILAEVLRRPISPGTAGLWGGLVAGYVFTGFDQPFFLMQRVAGFGLIVPQNWLAWHLPAIALLVTLVTLGLTLLSARRSEPAST